MSEYHHYLKTILTSLAVVVSFSICATTLWAQGNTAFGTGALTSDSSGFDDSAFGFDALLNNTTGDFNTAAGFDALINNSRGNYDTAYGADALVANTKASDNTAVGGGALQSNTTGFNNTAVGFSALLRNVGGTVSNPTLGSNNTATGVQALQNNTTGDFDTALGIDALEENTTGDSNVAIGDSAGANLTTGSNNIYIGNRGGVATESNAIRVGTEGTQTNAFIAGIDSNLLPGTPSEVFVDSNGQLGVIASSARYKRDIHDMGKASDKLMRLRPVAFRYKADPTGTQQYGLIAEEVAKVYPELVVNGADGKPQTVAYQVLPAMLLNELQKKDRQIAALQQQLNALQKKSIEFDARMNARMDALEQSARASSSERLAAAMR